jgi:hypothetical protein
MALGPLAIAVSAGVVAAVATDCAYHRLLHVPFRRGPLRTLFLHHVAHHRYPDDPRILSFHDHRRILDVFIGGLAVLVFAAFHVFAPGGPALASSVAFALPMLAYNRAYGPLHSRVHLGGDSWLCRTRLFQRIRSHHLAHHAHGPGLASFRKARRLSLILPLI